MAKEKPTLRKVETNKKDHDPQHRAQQLKSEDNVRTANENDHTPNYPHPDQAPTGKHSGGGGGGKS